MRIKKAVMDGMPPTAVFCVIGSAVVTAKTVICLIFNGGMTMSECFAGGYLRFVDGKWRDDNGDAIEISRVRYGKWIFGKDLPYSWGKCQKINIIYIALNV